VGDQLPPRQRAAGYAMQSFFIGVGAVVASALPWLLAKFGVANTAAAGAIPDTVRYAFYAGGVVLMAAIGWTVLRTREYPPEVLPAFADGAAAASTRAPAAGARRNGQVLIAAGLALVVAIATLRWSRDLYVLAGLIVAYGAALAFF